MRQTESVSIHSALLRALGRVFRPLIRVCLRAGVSMGQIRAALDEAAVYEAKESLVEAAKRPSYSGISAMTGIARRHISDLLAHAEQTESDVSALQACDAGRVLNAWFDDPDFCNPRGVPLDLPLADGRRSFGGLSRKYAPNVSIDNMLAELVAHGTVDVATRRGQSMVIVRQSAIHSNISRAACVAEFGDVLGDAIAMFERNLRAQSAFERIRPYTVTAAVLAPNVKLLRRKLRERGEATTLDMSETLEALSVPTSDMPELARVDPAALYSIRVTLFSSVLPAEKQRPGAHTSARV